MPNDSLTNSAADTPAATSTPGLSRSAWQGLAVDTGPFVHWDFLRALSDTGCTGGDTGWDANFFRISRDGLARAAAPGWIKQHSHGEFVFDWAWARASMQAGMPWYPKLLIAAPFSPVTGPRLLGAAHARVDAERLVEEIEQFVEHRQLSSAGVNFCTDTDASLLLESSWLARFDWQFHWSNENYRDFDDFLERFRRKARKNLRAERRKVADAGWRFIWKRGNELSEEELDLVHRCYLTTFRLYGNRPSLNRAFFGAAARLEEPQLVVCMACHEDRPLAAAVFWQDHRRLYGRYWGSLVDARDVHFEACYYQGIEYCIRNGLSGFEPGAQGEHKIRRGFLPRQTRSFHYIRVPAMRTAIRRYLEAEGQALQDYRQDLERLNPFA